MIDHPTKGLRLSLRALDAFADIASGQKRWHAPKSINMLLVCGLIMRRAVRKPKERGFTHGGPEEWILTPHAWAHWTEYERQRAAEYVDSEEIQPAATVAITAKERA